jgi:hypothetical protein
MAEKIINQAFTFLEKASEIKFSLHCLCLAFYLDMALHTALQQPISDMEWTDFQQVRPSTYFVILVIYLSLMGLVFRFSYGFFSYVLGWLNSMYLNSGKTFGAGPYDVSKKEVLEYGIETKDYRPLDQFDEHVENVKKNRLQTIQLANLVFSILILLGAGYFNFFESALLSFILQLVAEYLLLKIIGYFLLMGFVMTIFFTSMNEWSSDDYLHHPALRKFLDEKNLKKNLCR